MINAKILSPNLDHTVRPRHGEWSRWLSILLTLKTLTPQTNSVKSAFHKTSKWSKNKPPNNGSLQTILENILPIEAFPIL